MVAPLVGAWIESINDKSLCILMYVAPLVGAWIERKVEANILNKYIVAPLVGAWIESGEYIKHKFDSESRSSCRSVD